MSEFDNDSPIDDDEGAGGGWIMTFADLMSLLMCFFVLLLSFSEIEQKKYKQVAGSMSKAFGVQRGNSHEGNTQGNQHHRPRVFTRKTHTNHHSSNPTGHDGATQGQFGLFRIRSRVGFRRLKRQRIRRPDSPIRRRNCHDAGQGAAGCSR